MRQEIDHFYLWCKTVMKGFCRYTHFLSVQATRALSSMEKKKKIVNVYEYLQLFSRKKSWFNNYIPVWKAACTALMHVWLNIRVGYVFKVRKIMREAQNLNGTFSNPYFLLCSPCWNFSPFSNHTAGRIFFNPSNHHWKAALKITRKKITITPAVWHFMNG